MQPVSEAFTAVAVVDSTRLDWQAADEPGVSKKWLDRRGEPPADRATALIRIEAGIAFPHHRHPRGEEVFVLEGDWRDEHGEYPVGSYIVSPEGSTHAPSSPTGCLLFVKLRQTPGQGRKGTVCRSAALDWSPGLIDGISFMTLYDEPGFPERVRLVRFEPGLELERVEPAGDQEVLILEGRVRDDFGSHGAGAWMRHPRGTALSVDSPEGCTFLVRSTT